MYSDPNWLKISQSAFQVKILIFFYPPSVWGPCQCVLCCLNPFTWSFWSTAFTLSVRSLSFSGIIFFLSTQHAPSPATAFHSSGCPGWLQFLKAYHFLCLSHVYIYSHWLSHGLMQLLQLLVSFHFNHRVHQKFINVTSYL